MSKELSRRILIKLYGINKQIVRKFILKTARKMDSTEGNYITLSEIFKKYWKVEIGEYSMGGCFAPHAFDPNTKIGRYCSFASAVRGINANHPMDYPSTHALFYHPKLNKQIKQLPFDFGSLEIGSDVWMGHNAIIMPAVTSIGHGAVIAAGAVVNKNIPPYAVVVGNPARIVRYRFSPEVIEKLLESKWWEKSLEDLDITEMNTSLIEEEYLNKK